ncbi:hypothetical protein C1H76_5632 [Elsinoe australis]|uniref:Uncharacterized protein n=1 Tax=Elsinoe australis TaxID=40998 RepID=A0A4U7B0C0_9PEZI|nr:hypothetical protein C1H76_5632 [Elsinoe australis]
MVTTAPSPMDALMLATSHNHLAGNPGKKARASSQPGKTKAPTYTGTISKAVNPPSPEPKPLSALLCFSLPHSKATTPPSPPSRAATLHSSPSKVTAGPSTSEATASSSLTGSSPGTAPIEVTVLASNASKATHSHSTLPRKSPFQGPRPP